MAGKKEYTKEEKIKKEKNRLKGIFKNLDENKKKLVTPLIEKAAFMSIELDILQDSIQKNGWTSEYQNGANQWGEKRSAEADTYIALSKNYTAVIKQLTELVPAAERKAFMNYVCRGVAIPTEYRAASTTTTAESGAVIPTTIMNEIITKLESYGSIYAKVRKINVQGGVSIPIADLKPTAHWITEGKSSDDQNASAKNSVTFNYYGLECKISQSILANVVTLKMFTDLFVPMATEAMVKAIEISIFNGTGEGQPLGVLKDNRVTTVVTLTPEEYASWSGWHKVKAKMKKAYRNGSFIMNQSTFDVGIDGMEDKNGQPIGRTNYGVNGEETYRFMGKNVETVEDDILPSWDDANEGDVIAVFMNFSDYVINTNMEMQVVKWTDHDNNKIKNKCLMVADGKVADAAGIILVKKGVKSV